MTGLVQTSGGRARGPEEDAGLPACWSAWLGRVEYIRAWDLQKALARARAEARIPDTVLFLEHPPTYTLGRRGREEHLLVPRETLVRQGVALHRTDRGGDITFHGPGQLVVYPVISLRARPGGAGRYLRDLEEVVVEALTHFGVASGRMEGYTGVWTGGQKIAAIGAKIDANRVTQHGLALNVTTDLAWFDRIVPCGIRDRGVTSLARVIAGTVSLAEVAKSVAAAFSRVFGVRMLEVEPGTVWKEQEGPI